MHGARLLKGGYMSDEQSKADDHHWFNFDVCLGPVLVLVVIVILFFSCIEEPVVQYTQIGFITDTYNAHVYNDEGDQEIEHHIVVDGRDYVVGSWSFLFNSRQIGKKVLVTVYTNGDVTVESAPKEKER
jgi:hypothetical protein